MTAQADVVFRGNASDVTRAGRQAERAVAGVERSAARGAKHIDAMGKSAERQNKHLSAFGRSTNLLFGAAGLGLGISSTITAFKDLEKVNSHVSASLKTLGINTQDVRDHVDNASLALERLSGFSDRELKDSFATLVLSTGDVDKALKGSALAADIARARGQDLGSVTRTLAKVFDGNANAAKRLGVVVQKGATVQDALAAAQKRYAGQARAYGDTTSGAADKANASFERLQSQLGHAFVPALNAASGGLLRVSGATQTVADRIGGLGPIVSGAAGFGAFQLAAPQVQRFGGLLSRIGANAKAGGGGIKGLAGALSTSVSPMGLAAVGAGILAGGVYAIWQNSENADQAVQGLNSTLRDTSAARGQQETAKNNVNAAKDYVNATKDAESAARSHARTLHGAVVERQKDLLALQQSGGGRDGEPADPASAAKIEAAQKKVTAATKEWRKSLTDIVPAVHAHQTAQTNLASAQRNLVTSTDGVRVAQEKVARKIRDVIEKAKDAGTVVENTGGRWSAFTKVSHDAGRGAEFLAGKFDRASRAAKGTDSATSIADATIATVIRTIKRVPSEKQFKLITNMASEGAKADAILAKLARMHDKQITVRFNQTFGARVNPFTGLPAKPAKPATGAWVAGRYGDGDRVPAYLSGEEAVLNPGQIDEVGRGRVMHALRGAPVIGLAGGGVPHFAGGPHGRKRAKGPFRPGARLDRSQVVDERGFVWPMVWAHFEDGSAAWVMDPNPGGIKSPTWGGGPTGGGGRGFAGGGKPRYVRSNLTGLKRTTATPAQRVEKVLASRAEGWDMSEAKARLRIATADAAGDPTGNALAYEAEAATEDTIARALRAILSNPEKTLGVQGGKLTRGQRTRLLQALASAISQAKSDRDTAYGLRHPAVDDTGGADASGGDAGSGSTDTGPTPDQAAILAQSQARLATATRSAALSEAEVRAFGSRGDIGAGNFGNAFDAARGGPQMVVLGDARSAMTAAAWFTQGAALQPSRTANRQFVGI